MEWIEAEGKPGFYRVIQTQRVIWAEEIDGKLRSRKWPQDRPIVWNGAPLPMNTTGKIPRRHSLPQKEKLIPRTLLDSYQPETQFAFFVDRLALVNL
jgi:hypothetical protein